MMLLPSMQLAASRHASVAPARLASRLCLRTAASTCVAAAAPVSTQDTIAPSSQWQLPLQSILDGAHLDQLKARGYVVADLCSRSTSDASGDLLPQSCIAAARAEAKSLLDSGRFEEAGQPAHRGDLICHLSAEEALSCGHSELAGAVQMLRRLPQVLEDPNDPTVVPLAAPARAMLSLYDGGAAYAEHVDGVPRSQLGFFGAVQAARATGSLFSGMARLAAGSSSVRFREYTCILYLNAEDWDASHDGGCLRVFPAASSTELGSSLDLAPIGGRLVVFCSRTMRHAVLPSRRQRIAMTMWLEDAAAAAGAEVSSAYYE
eukprot:gnl/TRDRNA2_/TRDRNA2_125660_c0_seq2.p1 gnl/TRDRNA2_/TRDRNA2_125660_c0~~gnl/TRDRNA2_/TRDRNA2_125660_c0_seq2.p1  ORF type:complete len:319 (-),score=49.71 gnl/TRDRNA2_/TRDRNA2_125660_c0_seq2:3-959(-)